jgi:hypothetical protein
MRKIIISDTNGSPDKDRVLRVNQKQDGSIPNKEGG